MRYILIVLLSTSYLCGMQSSDSDSEDSWFNRLSLERVVKAKNEVGDACASFLRRFQTTPTLTPQSSPAVPAVLRQAQDERALCEAGEQEPLRIELADSRSHSTSPLVLGEAIIGKRIPDSPPKSPLLEDAVMGNLIPEKPTIFRLLNKTSRAVKIHVILTAPYKAKRYIITPQDSMLMVSFEAGRAQFEEVHIPYQEDSKGAVFNTHLAKYTFKDAFFARLVILPEACQEAQLKIVKRGIF